MLAFGQHGNGNQPPGDTTPDRQAPLPDVERLNGVRSKPIRPVVDDMEQPGAYETCQDHPNRRIVDVFRTESFAVRLFGGEPGPDRNRSQYDEAVPAQVKVPNR